MENELYFRFAGDWRLTRFDYSDRALYVRRFGHVYFDTLFNSFSIGKWMKYTRLDNLRLRLDIKGRFQAKILAQQLVNDEIIRHVLLDRTLSARERAWFELEIPCDPAEKGIYCLLLDALDADNAFYGGSFETEVDASALNPVDIAVDICTFRRECFVERNMEMLNRQFMRNPDSELYGHLSVFVSDNGRTLDARKWSDQCVHVFGNKNAGGAGGFCRGMMEILDEQKRRKRPFSHVLVMDDDVLVNPEAILRTARLLRLMKPEYHGKTVAGSMMRLDKRNFQHECGGWWDGAEVRSAKCNLDMVDVRNVMANEREFPINFNAWWYSCIPMEKISNDNLPLPLFIRFDDVEFGLRSGSDIVSLNGICLWHEPFEYKYSSSMEYYHMRNCLIVNAFHRPDFGPKQAVRHMQKMVARNLARYRYANIDLIFRAVEDFCQGPEQLFSADVEAKHRELMAASDRFLPLEQLSVRFDEQAYRESFNWAEGKRHRLARLLTLNGLLLPAKGQGVVNAVVSTPLNFYRKKEVLNYEVAGNRGFVSRKDMRRTVAVFFRLVKMSVRLRRSHARLCEEYRAAQKRITSRAFWNRYLDL